MKKFIYEFINEKGWMHFIVMLAIIYILIFWGNSDYAQSTKLFPSEMVSSITTSGGNKTIDLRGTNGARTSASNSAVTYLQGIGFTVLTN